jgi:hypothetical protein
MLSFIQIAFLVLGYNQSSPNPDLSCIKPVYFNQAKWIADSTGSAGYKSSIVQSIVADSSFIGRSKLYLDCVFRSDCDIQRNNDIKSLSYSWFSQGYRCMLIFELKRNRVVEIRQFKGCG